MLADEQAFTHTLFGTKIMVKGFFTSVLEAPALNMGVFVGLLLVLSVRFTTSITIIGNYQMRYHFLMVNGLSHLSLFYGQQLSQLH